MNQNETLTNPSRVEDLLLTLGKSYLDKKQYAEAYEKYAQLIGMGKDDAEILLNAAIAGIGANDVSEPACAIYERAVQANPDSRALLLGLATLFVQHDVQSDFAIETCERAAEAWPDHGERIHAFLKAHYEQAGEIEKAREEERKAVEKSTDPATIFSYVENLWWQGRFDEALELLESKPAEDAAATELELALALTHAYRAISEKQTVDPEARQRVVRGLAHFQAVKSLNHLRHYVTLRVALPENFRVPELQPEEYEEFQFILGLIPIEEYFNRLKALQASSKPDPDPTQLDPGASGDEPVELSVLVASLVAAETKPVPERLLNLVETHLAGIPESLLRQFSYGYISYARQPQAQIDSVVKLLDRLEEYNAATSPEEQVRLQAAIALPVPHGNKEYNPTLTPLLYATHCLHHAKRLSFAPNSGWLLLQGSDEQLQRLQSDGVTLLISEKITLLPGLETPLAEVLWHDPLARVHDTRPYTLSEFDVRQRLVQHPHYGTFVGRDRRLQRDVILKIMPPQVGAPYLNDRTQLEALLDAMRKVAAMNHPNIATIFDLGEQDRMVYLAREYVEGSPITAFEFQPAERESEIVQALQKVVRALTYAQDQGLAHLNLKPENVWINASRGIKLTDFRIPGFEPNGEHHDVLFPGSWRYAAPEVLAGEAGDVRSDIYSFGVLAFELVAGKHPYSLAGKVDEVKDIFNLHLPTLSDADTPLSSEWNALFARCIQGNQKKRYKSWPEVEAQLRQIQLKLLERELQATTEGEG